MRSVWGYECQWNPYLHWKQKYELLQTFQRTGHILINMEIAHALWILSLLWRLQYINTLWSRAGCGLNCSESCFNIKNQPGYALRQRRDGPANCSQFFRLVTSSQHFWYYLMRVHTSEIQIVTCMYYHMFMMNKHKPEILKSWDKNK